MPSDLELIAHRRTRLTNLIDSLSVEFEDKLRSGAVDEDRLNDCLLNLNEKLERLRRITDKELLSLLTKEEQNKVLDEMDLYEEKCFKIEKKYDQYKESKKKRAEKRAPDKHGEKSEKPLGGKIGVNNKNKSGLGPSNTEPTLDWSQDSSILELPALGTLGYIGQLYDATTNKYFPKTFFTTNVQPSKFISVKDLGGTFIKFGKNDQLSDRFELLDVKPEQQLSILCLPSKFSGHGEYLLREIKSHNSSAATLLYRYSSKMERLITPITNVKSFIDENVFLDPKYTHVVVGIVWGAICTVTLEQSNEDENNKENVKISLLNKLNQMRVLIESQMTGHRSHSQSYEETAGAAFQMYSDISINKQVKDIKMASDFIIQIPERIEKEGKGYGVPLTYILLSLSNFANFFTSCIKSIPKVCSPIDEEFIKFAVKIFEELAMLKQKLHDFDRNYFKNERVLSDTRLRKIKNIQKNINTIEMELNTNLREIIPQIRCGQVDERDLKKIIQKSRSDLTNLKNDIKELEDKLNIDFEAIKCCDLHNIVFLKKNENLDDIVLRMGNYDLYVLYTSEKIFESNQAVFGKVFKFFTSMADDSDKNSKLFLVDLDVNSSMHHPDDLKIYHYKNGRIISKDVFAGKGKKKLKNFAKVRSFTKITDTSYKPLQRSVLKLRCPGSVMGCCGADSLIWHCSKCNGILEYGFDDYFYCHCGNGHNLSFEFKCCSSNHGDKYVALSQRFPLKHELNKLRPLEELNILILGQSGVGKSTWINSIANYFQYKTLEEARQGGVICAIPASFNGFYESDGTRKIQTVTIGEKNNNENTDVGQSGTKGPKTYNFVYNNRAIRLIDTPGVGDTDGIVKDKENMRKIVDHIGFLKEIHGICILLKSNETRLNVTFRFCINELLTHLHKNAARNIIFCFTHSRTTFYSMGDTSAVLGNLLKKLELDDLISLSPKTTFFLDNEAFRFLCSLNYPDIKWTDDNEAIYIKSWKKSVEETERLFECVQKLNPHKVEDTTILCHARNKILNLIKPLAEITQAIQTNRAAIAEENKKIRESKERLDELAAKLIIPQIILKPERLRFPKMVCASPKCITYVQLERSNISVPEYLTVCHDHCSLSNINSRTHPNEDLKQCHIFNYDLPKREKCCECGCNWDSHMHLTYIQKRVERPAVNQNIQNEINSKKDAATEIEEHKRELELTIEEYEKEQDTITEICLEFATFLRESCITPYNDAFMDYLEYLIKEEDEKPNKTEVEHNIIRNLIETRRDYEEQIKMVKESARNKDSKNAFAVIDIASLEQKLYILKLTGEQIKKTMEVSRVSNFVAHRYAEEPLPIRTSIEKEM